MAIHGLTRVKFEGGKTVVVAGAVPQHIEEQAVDQAPQDSPLTRRHLAKKVVLPPRFVAQKEAVEPQVETKETE